MEAMDERERYIKNPLRLLRCGLEMANLALRRVDDNLFDFGDYVESRPFTPENYPMNWTVEAPVAEEDMLWQQDY